MPIPTLHHLCSPQIIESANRMHEPSAWHHLNYSFYNTIYTSYLHTSTPLLKGPSRRGEKEQTDTGAFDMVWYDYVRGLESCTT